MLSPTSLPSQASLQPSLAPWLGVNTPVVGTLTVLPLPGSLLWQGAAYRWMTRIEQDALALATGSVDAILVVCSEASPTEPFNPAASVLLTQALGRVRQLTGKPVGLSVGASIHPQASAAALAVVWGSGATFLRVPVAVGGLMTANGLVSGQLTALSQAYDAWHIPADAVAIVADVSRNLWLPNTAMGSAPSLLESATAIQQGFGVLPAGTPTGFIAQQADVSGDLLSTFQQQIHNPLWIEAGEDPIACVRLTPQSQGVLLGKVIEKSTSPSNLSTASPGIDVPKLEHWVRGLQHTFHQQATASSATNEAPCQPISQPLS